MVKRQYNLHSKCYIFFKKSKIEYFPSKVKVIVTLRK